MGKHLFQWAHNAEQVYVTGTFDDWKQTVKLEKNGEVFEKEVDLPVTADKVYYKYIVDGNWVADDSAPQEDDGNNNINNVLIPSLTNGEANPATTTMSGVTPESTTAALAAGVPKESDKPSASETTTQTNGGPGAAAISSAAPDSTTAELAKDVPKESNAGSGLPGAFPNTPGQTPGQESESFSVNPLPATAGTGNPIQLQPGEKVPDPSTFTNNTVESTARTDQAGYEQDASAGGFGTGGEKGNTEGGDALEAGNTGDSSNANPTIQSAAPTSTTAALAAGVPLEPAGKSAAAENGRPAETVPEVVRDSLAEAHRDPEAAASGEAVGEKKDVEQELLKSVPQDQSTGVPASAVAAATNGAPAPDVPNVVTGSHDGGAPLEAATSREAVAEKKEVEEELLKKVPTTEEAGEPAPTATAETTETAPVQATTTSTNQKKPVSREVSPMTKDPNTDTNRAAAPEEPTVTTGPTETQVPKDSKPETAAAPAAAPAKSPTPDANAEENGAKDKKKKNRASGFFAKLKEKFK